MKGNDEVIRDFNEYVNMTADDLEKWLKSDDSRSAGWPKGESAGESVGHDSGRKIVEILKTNPKKDTKKYTDDQVSHMRKVVSYCARHLAQEEKSNNAKSPEEVKKTKSYASLKNWGHDPLKKRGAKDTSTAKSTANGKSAGAKKGADKDAEKDDQEEDDDNADKRAGDKRKAAGAQQGKNKEAKTEQSTEKRATRSSSRNKPSEEKEEKPQQPEKKTATKSDNKKDNKKKDEEKAGQGEEKSEDTGKESNGKKSGGKGGKGPKPGEKVSWNWGNGQPEGKVLDVKDDKATITTKRGNKVSRDGDPEDPAVIIDTGKSKAIKSNHELN